MTPKNNTILIKTTIQKSSPIKAKLFGGSIGNTAYPPLTDKPSINGEILVGDLTSEDLSLQNKLIAGENITLEDNDDGTTTISATGGGSGGSGELSSDLVVSNPLGKYAMDEVIAQGTGFETIFRGLLSKTYYPTLTNPSASLSYNSPTLVKVGAMVNSLTATLNFNRGSINPQYTSESAYRSGEATSYQVSLSGASVSFDETKQTNQFTVPQFTRTTKGNVVVNGKVNYAAGVQPKDSDGANYQSPLPAGNVTTSKTIEFIIPYYYGAVDSTDISSLTGLVEDVSKKGNKTYRITTNNQHLCIVYDSSYGNLTSILDANNFELINGWSKSTKIINGLSYNVYTANGATTDTNAQFTFKY